MPAITFYCPNKVAEKMKAEAISKGISVSKEIAEIINEYYTKEKKKESARRLSEMAELMWKSEDILKTVREERSYDRI